MYLGGLADSEVSAKEFAVRISFLTGKSGEPRNARATNDT